MLYSSLWDESFLDKFLFIYHGWSYWVCLENISRQAWKSSKYGWADKNSLGIYRLNFEECPVKTLRWKALSITFRNI